MTVSMAVADLLEAVEGRPLTVHLSRAHERRLRRNIERFNSEVPDDPMNPHEDEDLAVALVATSQRGLDGGDADDGVWCDTAGREYPLPRFVRAPVRLRLKFAWRSAVTAWRAT